MKVQEALTQMGGRRGWGVCIIVPDVTPVFVQCSWDAAPETPGAPHSPFGMQRRPERSFRKLGCINQQRCGWEKSVSIHLPAGERLRAALSSSSR